MGYDWGSRTCVEPVLGACIGVRLHLLLVLVCHASDLPETDQMCLGMFAFLSSRDLILSHFSLFVHTRVGLPSLFIIDRG